MNVNRNATGVRLKFQGRVLTCSHHRTRQQNEATVKKCLSMLMGICEDTIFGFARCPSCGCDKEAYFYRDGGTIEYYRSY